MITLEINDSEASRALDRLVAGLEDTTPAMQEIVEFLVQSTRDRITAGGPAPDGAPWAPKSEVTIKRQKRSHDGYDPRVLNWKGGLREQLHGTAGRDSVEWGSTPIYAATMQFGAAHGVFGTSARGAPLPWGTIPVRPFLGISDDDREGIVEIVGDYLEELADPH